MTALVQFIISMLFILTPIGLVMLFSDDLDNLRSENIDKFTKIGMAVFISMVVGIIGLLKVLFFS